MVSTETRASSVCLRVTGGDDDDDKDNDGDMYHLSGSPNDKKSTI